MISLSVSMAITSEFTRRLGTSVPAASEFTRRLGTSVPAASEFFYEEAGSLLPLPHLLACKDYSYINNFMFKIFLSE